MNIHILSAPFDSGVKNVRMGCGPGYLLDAGLESHLAANGHESSVTELDPTLPEAYWLLAAAHAQQGRFDLALSEFAHYESFYGGPVFWFRGYLYALAGQREDALRDLEELKQLVRQGASNPVELAQIYLGLGDREAVLGILEQATEAGVSFQPYLWPEYETYYSEPRFRAVFEKFSLPLPPTVAMREGTP